MLHIYAISEMQIKIISYHYIPTKWPESGTPIIASTSENVEAIGILSFIAGGNAKWYSLWKTYHILPLDPAITPLLFAQRS